MGIGAVLGAAAPTAAGYAAGSGMLGSGFLASNPWLTGALVGGGISALTGNDPLMGAAMGALGGMGGGELAGAAEAAKTASQGALTDAAANQLVTQQAMKNAGTGITSGITGATGEIGANLAQTISPNVMGTSSIANPLAGASPKLAGRISPNIGTATASQGARIGQSYAPDFMATANLNVPSPQFGTDYGISDIAENLGGESGKGMGYLKMAGMAGGPLLSGLEEPGVTDAEMKAAEKYDPTRKLNLGMDTGIAAALKRDSGLRLLANGGYLGGGLMGDGMSDSIKATINGQQEARLSDGEFVVPADVVSHLGNGSSDAGANRLYSMMDKVRQARTGTKQQGKEINPGRFMPA